MSVSEADPATMAPLEFARLVKGASTQELRSLMHGERRKPLLDELFVQMPGVFRGDQAGSIEAVIHWNVGDRPDGGTDVYEIVISGGTCRLSPKPEGVPKLTLSLSGVDFLNLVTGNAHPVMLVMRGKLKTKGDLGLTAKFPNLFDLPRP
jgi:hypothetical protein